MRKKSTTAEMVKYNSGRKFKKKMKMGDYPLWAWRITSHKICIIPDVTIIIEFWKSASHSTSVIKQLNHPICFDVKEYFLQEKVLINLINDILLHKYKYFYLMLIDWEIRSLEYNHTLLKNCKSHKINMNDKLFLWGSKNILIWFFVKVVKKTEHTIHILIKKYIVTI